jgi:PTH1 family peptidyl-tRNA hydrolase
LKYLIVGLGNIGVKYENTRHNIGFKMLDAYAKASNIFFSEQRLGTIAESKYKGRKLILLKPNTLMNLSGKAVNYWLQKENIPIENLLVLVDDLALPFSTIRLKSKGSDGGHNGLFDINQTLGHNNYSRLRFGIGSEFGKGHQVNYVLGNWTSEEEKTLPQRLEITTEIINSFVSIGINQTMNLFNNK